MAAANHSADRPPTAALTGTDALLSLLIAVGVCALMLAYCLKDIWWDDTGEFQVVSYLMGIAHAPGYPLIVLLGKLFTFLPVGIIPFRVTLMTVTLGALTTAALYLILVSLGARRWAAWSAAALFVTVPAFWLNSTMPEAYVPLAAATALMMLALLQWARSGRVTLLMAAAAAWGFYCVDRPTGVLYGPAVAAWLWAHRARFRSGRTAAAHLALSAAAFAVPVIIGLAYLWAKDRPDTSINWIEDANKQLRIFPEGDFTPAVKVRRLHWLLSARLFQNRIDWSLRRGVDRLIAFWRGLGPDRSVTDDQLPPGPPTRAGRLRSLLRTSPARWALPVAVFVGALVGAWWLLLKSPPHFAFLALFGVGDAVVLFGYNDQGVLDMCITGAAVIFLFFGIGLAVIFRAKGGRFAGPALAAALSLLVVLQAGPAEPLSEPDFGRRALKAFRLDRLPARAVVCTDWGWAPVLWYGKFVDPGRNDLLIVQSHCEHWPRLVAPYLGRRAIYLTRRGPDEFLNRYTLQKYGRLWKLLPPTPGADETP